MKFEPLDLKKLNIDLSSSDKAVARVAGVAVRTVRRMTVDFCPGADRPLFERLLIVEDQEIRRKRQRINLPPQ
jgi:hypothetical protein